MLLKTYILCASVIPVLTYPHRPVNITNGTKPFICGTNEIPTECEDPCLPTCDVPKQPPCTYTVCPGGCVCKEGYIRETFRGACVPISSCIDPDEISRNLTISCDENAVPTDCQHPCPATCARPIPAPCSLLWCVTGCNCKKGFVREDEGGSCIPRENCK